MSTTRRGFLKLSGTGLTALMLPMGLSRVAKAAYPGNNVLVIIYQRGGCDGLSLVSPQGDPYYFTLRPNVAITDTTLSLDQSYRNQGGGGLPNGYFAMHPALTGAKALYDAQDLAVIHGTGRTGTYSHFTAQDRMENADPNDNYPVGWLHRAVWQLASSDTADPETLTGVALDATGIQALRGPLSGRSLSLDSIDGFTLSTVYQSERETTLGALYQSVATGAPARVSAQDLLGGSGTALFSSLTALSGIPQTPDTTLYNQVGDVGFRRRLQDAARLIKDPALGVRILCLDIGGWDHHERLLGNMQTRSTYLGTGLAAFYDDLGAAASNTVTLVMTEFGRTAWENGGVNDGNAGTDHGWGSAMFAVGGPIQGQRVLCRTSEADGDVIGWPGLAPGQLHASGNKPVAAKSQPTTGTQYAPGERDLEVTIDYRDVFAEVMEQHMGLSGTAIYSSDPTDGSVIPPDPDPAWAPKPLPDGGLF